jgi:hypothetical protein
VSLYKAKGGHLSSLSTIILVKSFLSVFCNVPPSFWDGGAWERRDANGGRVGVPPNFREIQGVWGDIEVPSIGVLVSKMIKTKISLSGCVACLLSFPLGFNSHE